VDVTWSRWKPSGAPRLERTSFPAPAVWRPVPAVPWPAATVPAWVGKRHGALRRGRGPAWAGGAAVVLSVVLWASTALWRPVTAAFGEAAPATPIPGSAASPTPAFPGGPGPAAFVPVSASALRAALAAAEPPPGAPRPAWWSPALAAAAQTTGVPVALLAAVAQEESRGNPAAVSPAGALGLMQLMPTTASALGVQHVFDAAENALGGAEYLVERLSAYSGGERGCIPDPAACPQALRLALAAYNAGPGAVEHYHGVPPYPETQRYVREVTALYLQYRSEG